MIRVNEYDYIIENPYERLKSYTERGLRRLARLLAGEMRHRAERGFYGCFSVLDCRRSPGFLADALRLIVALRERSEKAYKDFMRELAYQMPGVMFALEMLLEAPLLYQAAGETDNPVVYYLEPDKFLEAKPSTPPVPPFDEDTRVLLAETYTMIEPEARLKLAGWVLPRELVERTLAEGLGREEV